MRIFAACVLLIMAALTSTTSASATTGDVLWSCDFEGAGSTAHDVVTSCGAEAATTINDVATIVPTGHDGKKAISYYYPNAGTEVVRPFSTPAINKQEITIDYWEKFDVDGALSTLWNVKSIRPYVGPASSDYLAATITRYGDENIYQSTWGSATLKTTSEVSSIGTGTDYCSYIEDNVYSCNAGRLKVGTHTKRGTEWYNIRVYIKVPSSATSNDGVTKVWVDNKLVYSLEKISKSDYWSVGWVPYVTSVLFHPSDDFFQGGTEAWAAMRFPFNHLYDDITIYEGLVEPGVPARRLSLGGRPIKLAEPGP